MKTLSLILLIILLLLVATISVSAQGDTNSAELDDPEPKISEETRLSMELEECCNCLVIEMTIGELQHKLKKCKTEKLKDLAIPVGAIGGVLILVFVLYKLK